MLKNILYKYRMRNLRKYYINLSIRKSEIGINAFAPRSDSESLDSDVISYIEALCDYIIRGIH